MPVRELTPYVMAMPAIQAEVSMAAAEEHSVGSGRLSADSHRATVRRWQDAMRRGPAAKPRTPEDIAAAIAGSGIGFRRIVKPG